ncbi:S8 family serine peptidase [Streptomyces sp. Y1]|uniref:S8 family serine peptidase n=1 Tax=Streptomyces sp. Y1 TaxID=3238634 RepID=A0AB39TJJ4_9ACTN
MGRTKARAGGRRFAAAVLAMGIVVGPAALPAAADGSIRNDQWHLDFMSASEMWKTSTGQGITVAVIDDGFKLDHPDLAGQFLPGKDFSESPGGVGSYSDPHGTSMVGLIAGTGKANGGKGAYGLAPGVKILPVKINNGSVGMGSLESKEFLGQIGQAIDYSVEHGAKVISISQGIGEGRTWPEDVAKLNRILASARARGALVFAAVGNEAQSGNPVEYPGALPNVVGVGAFDRDGNITAESETGPQVALVAPGKDTVAPCTTPSGYCDGHGTSDATALASASAALVWSAHPDWSPNQVLRVLINTAGRADGGTVRTDAAGWGSVRPRIALSNPGDPGPADVSPLPADVAAASAAPTPAAPSSASASASASPSSAPAAPPKVEVSSGSGGGSALPVVGGVVAGLVVVAGVVFVVVRRRRGAAVPPGGHPYV